MISIIEYFTTFDTVPIAGQISQDSPGRYPNDFMNRLSKDLSNKKYITKKQKVNNNKYIEADIKNNFGLGN